MLATNLKTVTAFPPIRLSHRGYVVRRATSREEMFAILRRRYHIFSEQMRVFPSNSHGFDIDDFDAPAEHLYASYEGLVVGGVRLLRGGPQGFPIETYGIVLPSFIPRPTAVEGSRFHAEPVDGHDVASDLLHATLRWSRRHHITHWIGLINARSQHALQRQGWTIHGWGPAVDLAGVPYGAFYRVIGSTNGRR